ncbi:TPA: hypothetical protein QBH27_002729 [Escherichia coli]|uniref:Uncharacterized protein n=2 Tax=Escherichia coli TaxID=562 RepID=A0A3L0U425_ECOLX|nr:MULTISPECIES: hypothetical protein [Gammaproteobacteria]EEZ5631676.1 hypothetical protein [Escherichia coli O25]EFA8804714.1 hypothetical protein [Escherichia coli O39:H4]EFD1460039.1 hypothetical protein [Escherichia coli O157:H7]EFZ6360467.1 hypothetical protein [Shigella boydii]EIO3779109.1 hypothetical protein [Shigella flexneri]EJE8509354.1 hypothetical protein [Shigella sonnei]HAX0003036.1 hypothetical protein [Escherichia coli KN1604]HAX0007237.1 hypothetical protein [Escherichia 
MTIDKKWLNRSNKDPGRSLRFTRQPV